MPKKIPWDEEEALILLDALLQVLSGTLTRKEAIAMVSEELRARAIHNGLVIDDTFRNQNGIHWQMSFMEYAYTGRQQGHKTFNVSELFQRVVSLYKNDQDTYLKCLMAAKSQIGPLKSIRDHFFEWLTEGLPSEQTLELYETVSIVCSDIEELCVRTGISTASFFEITDLNLVERILRAINSDECVQLTNERTASKMHSVLYLYRKFLRENRECLCTQAGALDNHSARGTKNCLQGTLSDGSTKSAVTTEKQETFLVDFNYIEDMSFTYPLTLTYAGKETEYHKWNKLYVDLLSALWADHVDVFDRENEQPSSRATSVMIASSQTKENLRMPKAIGGDLYIEGNCSATQIINNIRHFLTLCGIDYSSVTIRYARRDKQAVTDDHMQDSLPPRFQTELLSVAESIISSHFVNGMRKNAAIAKKKFRRAYLDLTGVELPESIDIDELVSAVGFEHAGKFYVVSEANKQKLRELISEAVQAGNRIMFYEELYQRNLDFMTGAGIFSAELLKIVLKQTLPDMQYKRVFFSPDDSDNLETDIINCYGNVRMRTYCELKERLPYADLYQIRLACSRSSKFVWAKEETYALTDRIQLSQSDIDFSLDTVSQDIQKQGFSVFQRILVSESVEWNPDVPEVAIREALYIKHLSQRYERKRSIITLPGASFHASAIMVEYCKSLREATLSELQFYEEELTDKSIYSLSAAYDTMIRVDQERFVSPDVLAFDIDSIDNALSLFVQNGIVPLGSVNSFTSFPEVDGYPWNLFLLDSFCKHKSRKFRTMGGPAKSKPVGAIFPIQMQFDSYDALLAQVVAESSVPLQADAVAKFLTQNAYTLRRIETKGIITKTQEIRIQEGIADV